MNYKYILIFFILVLSCGNSETDGKNLAILGFYSNPNEIITTLKKGKPTAVEHFMLGIAYREQKKYKNAIHHFANSCFESRRDQDLKLYPAPVYSFVTGFNVKSPWYNDALYEIARLFYHYREYEYVIKFIDKIPFENTVMYRDAFLLKAKAKSDLDKHGEAADTLEKLRDSYRGNESKYLIHIRLASAYRQVERYSDAVKEYLNVLQGKSDSWQSVLAARELAGSLERSPVSLTDAEFFLLSLSLYHGGRYDESLKYLEMVKNRKEKSDEIAGLSVRNLARLKKTALVSETINSASDKNERARLMNIHADELWAMRKRGSALEQYRAVRGLSIEPYAREALKKIALYHERKKLRGYDRYLEQYAEAYPGDATTEYFLWVLGRLKIKNNDPKAAKEFLEKEASSFPDGEYTDRCRFWLYKLHEKANSEKADSLFRELVTKHLNSSYTWNALRGKNIMEEGVLKSGFNTSIKTGDRDKALYYHTLLFYREKSFRSRDKRIAEIHSEKVKAYRSLLEAIKKMKVSSKNRKLLSGLEKYFQTGYTDRINRELTALADDDRSRRDRYIALAHFGSRYGNSFITVRSILELLKIEKLDENIALMPQEMVTMLFPTPFEECVNRYSGEYGIKKSLLYAVIKAESLFNHTAVSPAGAVGLMQFMPATGRGLARQLKLESYDLRNPCTSVRFGARYLSWLKKTFNNNFIYIMSGYNAGAGNVNRWKKKQEYDDPDYMTEFTPYLETRYYILRTGKFRDQYEIIYPSMKN